MLPLAFGIPPAKRYEAEGERSPSQTPKEIEEKIRPKKAGNIPHTIRHILRRYGLEKKKCLSRLLGLGNSRAPILLPSRYQGGLGTKLVTHLSRHHLPRYQWTACDARNRLRFIAYSTCGLALAVLKGDEAIGPLQLTL